MAAAPCAFFSANLRLLRVILWIGSVGLVQDAHAQSMQVTSAAVPPFTPANLITNIFLGEGVEVLDVSFGGKPASVGYFTNGTHAVGLTRGIVMTTGLAETTHPAAGPFGGEQVGSVFASNNVGGFVPTTDPNLSAVASGPLFDVTSYTIRFIPTADTLRFRYCFASEEYPEFACSEYNDVFGFFISGPNYPTPTNIARIPGSSAAVAINNLHPDNTTPDRPCPPKNVQYYIDNLNSSKQPTYDGLTRVFTAEAVVVPCDTYTIRLVLADVGDPIYDSGVFLEAKSFGTGAVRAALSTPNLDGLLVEGCAPATLTFRLPKPDSVDVPISYNIWGSALNGVDIEPLPTQLVVPAGQQEAVLVIRALEDGLAEGVEWLAIDVQRDPCHRDTFWLYIRENDLVAPRLPADTLFCTGSSSLTLDATLPIPLPAPPFFERSEPLQIHPVNTSVVSALVVAGVSPPVLQPNVIRSVCLDITHGWVDDLDIYLIAPGGRVLELMTDCGANGKNFAQTCFTPNATRKIAEATAADAPFTGEWQPEGLWSDLWGSPANGIWRLILRDDQNGFVGTLQRWSITFEPSYQVTYEWSPPTAVSCATCPVITVAPTDTITYAVTATDAYGCTVSSAVTVQTASELPAPSLSCGTYTPSSVSFSWTEVPGAAGYLVNVNGSGWVAPNGTLSHSVDGLSTGASVTLAIQAISPTPCPTKVDSITCSNCDRPAVDVAVTEATCADAANGQVVLIPDGQKPPYTFSIGSKSNTTGVFDRLAAGTYSARVTDATGCIQQLNVVVGAPPPLTVSITEKSVTCYGGDDGALTAQVSGGTPPYQYLWSDSGAQKQSTAVNLLAGTYTVTIGDSNGCTATQTADVSSPTELVLFTTPIAARCHGEASGVAGATVSGGVGPYQFKWSNGQNTPVAVGLAAGVHGVTVTDAAGCAKASFALIGQPPPLALSLTGTSPSCAQQNDGTALAAAQGGTGGYTYLWNTTPPQSSATATKLGAGTYTVTVSDQNGCTTTGSITLADPPDIAVVLISEDARCYGLSDGSIRAQAQGGTGALSYTWSTVPPQYTAQALAVPAGTYTVTVGDANGCTTTQTATVGQPEPLSLSFDIQPVRCFGENNGRAEARPSGGTPPYTYQWSSGENTPALFQKTAGTYTLVLTDNNGCTASAAALIEQPQELLLVAQWQPIACHGQATGAIAVTPQGGQPPYSVLWDGPGATGSTQTELHQLTAGTYSVTLTDARGCTQIQSYTLTQPSLPLSVTLSPPADTLCPEQPGGTVSATASGGTPPYSYTWSIGGQTIPTAVALPPGVHTVTVSDALGCTTTGSAQIVKQPSLSLQLALEKVDCASGGTAFVSSAAYPAAPADLSRLRFLWSTTPPQTGPRAVNLAPGQTYTVTATDSKGCTAVQSIAIPAVLSISVGFSGLRPPTCFGGGDGQIAASATGGQPPYTFFWSNGQASADSVAYGLRAGTYTVTVGDRSGCTGTASVALSQPSALNVRLQTEAAKCFGDSTGILLALPEGGTPPYQIAWSTGQTGARAEHLPAGDYRLTLTDRNGCTLVKDAEVAQPDEPLRLSTRKKDIPCFGAHTGEITLIATGGTPPYRYSLNGLGWNGSPRQIGLPAGTYAPRASDRNGCTASAPPVTLEQRPALQVMLDPDTTLRFGQAMTLRAVVNNAEPPLKYLWSAQEPGVLSCTTCPEPEVRGLTTTQWISLAVTDAFGCTGTGRLRIAVEKAWRAYVPTAFSPNGDGNNDLLLVHGSPQTHVLAFDVYDRWGERVFSATHFPINDPYVGWDGTFRGQPLNPGVFVWVLQVRWPDASEETLRGEVTLVR